MKQAKVWTAVLVLLVIAAGIHLRSFQLDGKGMWSDELFSASIAMHRDLAGADQVKRFRRIHWQNIEDNDTFWTAKAADQSPPLFDFLTKASTALFGPSAIAMRLPSLVASVLTLVYLGYLALRASDRREVDTYLAALVLFAFSSAMIEFAQEARNYSLGLALVTVLITMLFRRLRTGLLTAPLPGWIEILVLVLACHTHYNLMAFCGALLLLYMFAAYRQRDWRGARRLLVVPLACLPWLILSAHTVLLTARGGVGWAAKMDMGRAVSLSLYANYQLLGKPFLVGALVLAGALIGRALLAAKGRRPPVTDIVVLLLLWLVYLLIAAKIASSATMFQPRYLLFGLPPLLFAIAIAIARVVPWRAGVLAVSALLAATQVPLIRHYFSVPKEGYREAAHWLLQRVDDQALVVATWWPNRHYYRYYLDQSDKRAQFAALSFAEESGGLCARFTNASSVAIIAHAGHRALVDALIASCGASFSRTEAVFKDVFAQHWTRTP